MARQPISRVLGITGVAVCIVAFGAGPSGSAQERPSQAAMSGGTIFRDDCTGCPEMVVVPVGTVMAGSPVSEEGRDISEGQYRVNIESRFAVGLHEVTFAEWDACVSDGGCGLYRPDDEGWGRGRRPVINVSREDALEYVRWLSRKTGESYRLLTEAEWEYVARAGTTTPRYWAESESGQCLHANGADAAARTEYAGSVLSLFASCSDGHVHTAPVGSFETNPFGLFDVMGNVAEWVDSCWDYTSAAGGDGADRSSRCRYPVLRGGAWSSGPSNLRSAKRTRTFAGTRSNDVGFRVARAMN